MIHSVKTDIESFYLYPASLLVLDKPGNVHTILGSCVSVCLHDPINKIGGINHYMLPFWNGNGLPTPKFGNIAIKKLLEGMMNTGSHKKHIIAKVFGGAEVLKVQSQSFNIGMKNILIANELLHEYKIPVVAHSTGGKMGRKIVFNIETGEVIQRFVKSQE